MLQAMFTGVSAIQADQQAMDVIGNNIANVNTTAYKGGRVTFEDQLAQTLQGAGAGNGTTTGGTNPQQVGLGVQVASIDSIMQQGGLQSTSRPTDMAIQGNGYFMLGDAGGVKYTRDGSFSIDNNGNLVNSANGSYVLGWQADSGGKINTTTQIGPSSHLSLPVGGLTSVNPTTAVTFSGNLSADGPADGTTVYTRSVKIYDSLGKAQNVTLTFTKTAANTWSYAASGDGAATGSGTLVFNTQGKLDTTNSTISPVTLNPNDGSAQNQSITPDFSTITQVSGDSNAAASAQNGFAPGTLQSFSIDQSGMITGIFNNGFTRPLGQIAMANFANPEGLERAGANAFHATINSGLPDVSTALQSGNGKISTGYLEQSNVDLSTEFTHMIITQRGFEANTKIVSTVDEMMTTLVQMKR